MNKNIKRVVKEILLKDKYARGDDNYLIMQVLQKMLPCNEGAVFSQVLQGMKYHGISFEAITRARRKVMEENPKLKVQSVQKIRRIEEENYFAEYSRHVPRID